MKRKPYSITMPESLSKIHENIKKLTGQSVSQQLLEADKWYLKEKGLLVLGDKR